MEFVLVRIVLVVIILHLLVLVAGVAVCIGVVFVVGNLAVLTAAVAIVVVGIVIALLITLLVTLPTKDLESVFVVGVSAHPNLMVRVLIFGPAANSTTDQLLAEFLVLESVSLLHIWPLTTQIGYVSSFSRVS